MEALLVDVFVKLESGENSHIWSVTPGSYTFYRKLFTIILSLDKLVFVWDDESNTWGHYVPSEEEYHFLSFSVANKV